MNIFVTLEQAKALKDAGYPQGNSYMTWFQYCAYHSHNMSVREHTTRPGWDVIAAPSAAEIMKEMKEYDIKNKTEHLDNIFCNWYRSTKSKPLIDLLVDAFVKMNKKEESKFSGQCIHSVALGQTCEKCKRKEGGE